METDLISDLSARFNGPLSLRLFLQPGMAMLFAWRDGRADAKSGAAPYLQRIFFHKGQRRSAISSAWASAGTVMILAFVLDCAFQFVVGKAISLADAAIMATLLCALPYSLIRGPVARLSR